MSTGDTPIRIITNTSTGRVTGWRWNSMTLCWEPLPLYPEPPADVGAERMRMRAGFARFARVMEEVWRCLLQEERKVQLMERYVARQRLDSRGYLIAWGKGHTDDVLRAEMSAEWSRRVREGVKALPPTGPRVYCQSEED